MFPEGFKEFAKEVGKKEAEKTKNNYDGRKAKIDATEGHPDISDLMRASTMEGKSSDPSIIITVECECGDVAAHKVARLQYGRMVEQGVYQKIQDKFYISAHNNMSSVQVRMIDCPLLLGMNEKEIAKLPEYGLKIIHVQSSEMDMVPDFTSGV